ncbi:MAG: hypothetical protein LBR75_03320, partial [Prevotellaceae bacterium]|nr:hypothetical protein [Prevotellaceae bacterium]
MKTKLLTLTAFLALFLTANAQVNIEERMKKENVVRGMIIQNGKETEGYIKKVNEKRSLDDVTYNAFDKFQSDISFIPKNDFETAEKLTKKMYVKVEPKTAEGYKYIYESGDTLVYESVKYADKSEISLRMIAKPVFLRVESKGRLEIYTYYVSPPSLLIGNEIREYYEAAGEPIIVYRRAGNEKSPEMIEF